VGREIEGFVEDVPQQGARVPVRGLDDPEALTPGYGLQAPHDGGVQAASASDGRDKAVVDDQLIPEYPSDEQRRPYAKETLDKIGELAPFISGYSKKYGVPPLAVAGAIANEYDTRFDLTPKAVSHYDALQDWLVPRVTGERGPLTTRLDRNRLLPAYAGSPTWLNSDIGPANIHLATALQLWHSNPGELPASVHDYPSLARYVVSNEGTAQLAAKYISWAQREFDNSLGNTQRPLSPHDKAALYIDYFRKGPDRLHDQWVGRLQSEYGDDLANQLVSGALPLRTHDLPRPVDGVRAIVNRHALEGRLGQGRE
jgi:hypothetical protein